MNFIKHVIYLFLIYDTNLRYIKINFVKKNTYNKSYMHIKYLKEIFDYFSLVYNYKDLNLQKVILVIKIESVGFSYKS